MRGTTDGCPTYTASGQGPRGPTGKISAIPRASRGQDAVPGRHSKNKDTKPAKHYFSGRVQVGYNNITKSIKVKNDAACP